MLKRGKTWSQLHLSVHLSLQKAKTAYRAVYGKALDPVVREEMEAAVWKTLLGWAMQDLEYCIFHSTFQYVFYHTIADTPHISELVARVLLKLLLPGSGILPCGGILPCAVFNNDQFWETDSVLWQDDYYSNEDICRRCSLIYLLDRACHRGRWWSNEDARRLIMRNTGLAGEVEPGMVPDIRKVIDRSLQTFRRLTDTERRIIEKHIYKSAFLTLFYFADRSGIDTMLTDGEVLQCGIRYFLIRKVLPPCGSTIADGCHPKRWRVKQRVRRDYKAIG